MAVRLRFGEATVAQLLVVIAHSGGEQGPALIGARVVGLSTPRGAYWPALPELRRYRSEKFKSKGEPT